MSDVRQPEFRSGFYACVSLHHVIITPHAPRPTRLASKPHPIQHQCRPFHYVFSPIHKHARSCGFYERQACLGAANGPIQILSIVRENL